MVFDTGAARSVFPPTYRPDVPIEPSKEIPLHQADGTRVAHLGSKFLSKGVGNQKIEGTFDVRNVTLPIVAAGQVTGGNGGYILDMRSAKKIERLLGNKGSVTELKKQKGVYVIPSDEPSSSLESKQPSQMDKGDVEVEEDRPARVKGAPVLPIRKRPRRTRSHTCDTPQLVRGGCGRACNGRFSQAIDERIVGATGGHGQRIPWSRH